MNNKKFDINIFMFIFFFLLLLTLGIDYISYFFKFKYLISFIISFILNIIISYFILKKVKINIDLKKQDLIFYFVLFLIFCITIVFPDRTFDTFNYHLYLQENPFGNKINFDYFAGKNLNSFSYAFPDRIFYVFRFLLGYRLGVILNYLIIINIFYQTKNILNNIIPKSKEITKVIFSLLIATSLSLIDIIDSYYIDLVSATLLLEIFRLILTTKINDDNYKILIIYYSLLFSFSFITKISNAPILLIFFIIFIINNKNIKNYINLKNILLGIIILLIPCSIYVFYVLKNTGNPVFPFYNTIFKSKYFGNRNWLDKRFGPQSLIGILIYPVKAIFHPEKTCDISIFEPIWGYGYVISIIYLIVYSIKKIIAKSKIDSNRSILAITTFLVYLAWGKFQLGYTRYGFISLILGCIITYIFLYDLIKNKKYLISLTLLVLLFLNFKYTTSNYMLEKKDWIYNNFFNSYSSYKYNLKNIFSRGNEITENFEKGSVWGIIYNNSGLAQMINPDIPIINITDSVDNKYTEKLLTKKLTKATHIYTVVDSLDMDNFLKRLNVTEYKITDVKDVITTKIIGRKESYTYIFELKKEKFENKIESIDLKKEIDVSKNNKVSFFLGLDKWTNNLFYNDVEVIIYADGKEIDKINLSNKGKMVYYEYDVKKYKKLTIECKDTWLLMINYDSN